MGDEASTATILYGNPGGESAGLGAIDTALSGGMEPVARQLRMDGDHDIAREMGGYRRELAGALHELGFSQASAQAFGSLVEEYWNKESPQDAEAAKANMDRTLEELAKEWKGRELEDNVAGALDLIRFLRSRSPGFAGFLDHTGMHNDARLLRILGGTAKYRRATGRK